jgi:hypothetical protein
VRQHTEETSHSRHILHDVTSAIVAEAKSRRAQIVVEKLDGLKLTITTIGCAHGRRLRAGGSFSASGTALILAMVS